MALDVKRTVFAVDRTVGEVLVGLDLFHERQTALVGPVRIARRDPLIEIVALRPEHRHDVYRRAAAHDAPGQSVVSTAVDMALRAEHRHEVGFQ